MEELAKTVVEKDRAKSPMNQEMINKIRRELSSESGSGLLKRSLAGSVQLFF